MYKIDAHCACAVAGITADANILISQARLAAQRYQFRYQEPIPAEQLVQQVCDIKQSYTQFGGLRPFGVSFLFAAWDRHYGYQLYHSDPSGNYSGWKATAIGSNHTQAQSLLKSDYKPDASLEDTLVLSLRVLGKTMDSTSLSPERLDICTLVRDAETGAVTFAGVSEARLKELLDKADLARTVADDK